MIDEACQVVPSQIPNPSRTWQVGTLTYSFGGLAALFGWLLCGDFALSVRERAMQGMMQLLLKKFGASDMISGLLIASLPAAIGLIIGPVVGYKSDRLRTGWGRRIPFLLLTTPFIVLAVLGLAFCPQLGGGLQHLLGRHSPGTAPSVLIVLAILWTIYDMSVVISGSVFGGLLNDVVPTEVLGRFFGLFRIVSLLVGIIFFFWIMEEAEAHFTPIFIAVALIYGLGFSLMCFKVKEGDYPPIPQNHGGPGNAMASFKAYFKDGFGHSYYLWFFAATILGGMATGPVNLYSIFYAKSLSMDMGTFGKCLAVTYTISLCLSYPLGSLVDRFHPLRLTMGVLGIYVGAMAVSFYFVHSVNAFAVALVVHGVISGTYGTISASLGQRLLPRAKFAEICSAGGIIGSLAGMAMAPILGTVLDYRHHDYRYTFLAGLIFSVSGLVAFTVLHGKFMNLGGPTGYAAPE